MAQVAPAEGAGHDAQQLAQQRRGHAPDRVAHQLEEVQRPLEPVGERPDLLPEDRRVGQLGQGHVQHGGDLTRIGRQRRPTGQRTDVRHDVGVAGQRVEVVELTDQLDRRGVEVDLLLGLAQRRLGRRLPDVDPAAREADLAAVMTVA